MVLEMKKMMKIMESNVHFDKEDREDDEIRLEFLHDNDS